MTLTSTEVFSIRPLPAPVDDSDGVVVVADAPHSFPCRRCLQDAEPGELLLLVGYDPFEVASPYSGRGPIYLHVGGCAPYAGSEVPDQQRRRLLSVRGYDAASLMTGAVVVPGTELEEAAAQLLEDRRTAFLHVHNAGPGCFAVRLDRGGGYGRGPTTTQQLSGQGRSVAVRSAVTSSPST